MLRSLFACCVIGSCLALVGCEPPKAQKPAENTPAPVAKDAPNAEKAAVSGDKAKAGNKDKGTRKKKAPHVTTAK
jgi:hypothetical protein